MLLQNSQHAIRDRILLEIKYLVHYVRDILFTRDYVCAEADPGLSARSRILGRKGEREIGLLLALPKQEDSWELPTAGEWAEMKS